MKRTALPTNFRHGSMWVAAAAALVLGALAVGVLLTSRPGDANKVAAAGHASPGTASSAAPPASAEELAAASVANVTPFICAASTLSAPASRPVAPVDALRTGAHAGYDRVVVEFSGTQPARIELRPQATAAFTGSPRGNTIQLAGRHGIAIVIRGSDMHTAYAGSRDLKTAYASLAETRVIEDFEGQVILGLGLRADACYRAFVLTSPVRLVVDVQTS